MNDEVFVVAAHTPDDKREQMLRNLVTKLHAHNKDIILITHTVTPDDIIKKCTYFIYDKENTLLRDDKYKFLVWTQAIPNCKIYSRDANQSYTTIIAVYRLLLRGLGFAKMTGYKYAHFIEYDTDFDTIEFFNTNLKSLKEGYGCVVYKNIHDHPIGCYSLLNLDHYSFDELNLDEQKILAKFTEYYPDLYFVEQITKIFYFDNKNPYYKREEMFKDEGFKPSLYITQYNDWKVKWAIPIVENDELYLFLMEFKNKNMKVEYVINDSYKTAHVQPHNFVYFKLCDYKDAKFLKIIVDDVPFLEYDLTVDQNREKLKENNLLKRI